VGGSSTVNACVWLRGSAGDYDAWAQLGNPGWSFADLLPSFRRAETDPLGGPLHGDDGPVPVFRVTDADLKPLDFALAGAANALGLPWIDDLNGSANQQPCVGPTPKNIANGVRMSAALTYLAPVRGRPNLTIVPYALVDRVLIEDGRATGVRTADGREVNGRQIILCAGAYGSPAILLRSGIGPAADLNELGIPIIANRPGVGAHLLDHPSLLFAGGDEIAPFVIKPDCAPSSRSVTPLLIKGRSRQTTDDIDFYVFYNSILDETNGRWTALIGINLETAWSEGRMRLTSPDPEATLDIDHRYFENLADLEVMCDGAEFVAQLIATEPLSNVMSAPSSELPRWRNRDELRAWVRERVVTTFHPSGTCRMGAESDSGSVVDSAGRVHRVTGLRVADASIFPTIPRANIHCTIVASAEKLAEVFRREFPA
jgi:choline dehydrogenase